MYLKLWSALLCSKGTIIIFTDNYISCFPLDTPSFNRASIVYQGFVHTLKLAYNHISCIRFPFPNDKLFYIMIHDNPIMKSISKK